MWSKFRRIVTALLAVALVVTMLPVRAAAEETTAEPFFKKVYTEMYENLGTKGVYTLYVKNLKKGYIVNWKITGGGKAYASLENKKTVSTKSYVSNKVTVNSEGNSLEGKRIKVTASVYDSKKKLVKTLSMIAALKCKATAIKVDTSQIEDLSEISVGKSYQFSYTLTPANSTSIAYWKVTNSSGTDVSSEITADGLWTPTKAGTYTVMVYARNKAGGKVLCKNSVKATAGTFIQTVTQTASNALELTFNEDISSTYTKDTYKITSGNISVGIGVSKVHYSADGKTAYLTTTANFADKREYSISCGTNSVSFTASVGNPVTLSILTSTVQAGKETTIEYALYDANGIDVTNTVTGNFKYDGVVTNGMLVDNKLVMQTAGKTANITINYTSVNEEIKLSDSKLITCVAAAVDTAGTTRFTITESASAPDFSAEDVHFLSVGDEMYGHFRALDANDAQIKYDSITYASTDNNILIIDQVSGRMTPIKTGTVGVTVTVKQGSATESYTFQITVQSARVLTSLQLSENSIMISNVYETSYQKSITVAGRDQYGRLMSLTDEVGNIKSVNGSTVLASYDADKNAIIIKAQGVLPGTYSYTLEISKGTAAVVSQGFQIVVQTPSYNSSVSYGIEASTPALDMQVDEGTSGDKTIELKLAEYRGGIFSSYKTFNMAVIRKGSYYYNTNLQDKSTSQISIGGSNVLTLTPVVLQLKDEIGTCTKAEQGTYIITMNYTNDSGVSAQASASITLTDSQSAPAFTVRSLTATKKAATALELVNSCLEVSSGTIIDCTAVGTTKTGNEITLTSGQQLHINDITVQTVTTVAGNKRVYVTQTVSVDQTLTNL